MSITYPGHVAGVFAGPPRGVILHGSRGGAATVAREFAGTVAWAANPSHDLGWTATIGRGAYSLHITPRAWGWNAREHSREYLAVEFAQPTVADPIYDDMVAAFALFWRREVVPVWPHLDRPTVAMLPTHSELPAGIRDGKSDIYPRGDPRNEEVRQRILAALTPTPDPTDAALEAAWRQARPVVGEKLYAASLSRPFYTGKVIVCERGVVTPAGPLDAAGIRDDLETYWTENNVLVAHTG